jgi:hypothetical protein
MSAQKHHFRWLPDSPAQPFVNNGFGNAVIHLDSKAFLSLPKKEHTKKQCDRLKSLERLETSSAGLNLEIEIQNGWKIKLKRHDMICFAFQLTTFG